MLMNMRSWDYSAIEPILKYLEKTSPKKQSPFYQDSFCAAFSNQTTNKVFMHGEATIYWKSVFEFSVKIKQCFQLKHCFQLMMWKQGLPL
jgi:hypothetical protein